jgi:hypothetical protein
MFQNFFLLLLGYLFGALKLYASFIFIQKWILADAKTIDFYLYGMILLMFISIDADRFKDVIKGVLNKS